MCLEKEIMSMKSRLGVEHLTISVISSDQFFIAIDSGVFGTGETLADAQLDMVERYNLKLHVCESCDSAFDDFGGKFDDHGEFCNDCLNNPLQ